MSTPRFLLVEKYTNLECLQSANYESVDYNLNQANREVLELHNQHKNSVTAICQALEKHKLPYQIVKDSNEIRLHIKNFTHVVSLGGDGTLLHAAKYCTNQLLFGVQTQAQKSVGHLLQFTAAQFVANLKNVLQGKNKVLLVPRLSVTINQQPVDFRAFNEIFCGHPLIYKTSHLWLKLETKEVQVRSNGVLFVTPQGQDAFYKSAGGKPFYEAELAYQQLFPYQFEGDLPISGVYENHQPMRVRPLRMHQVLVFDGDVERVVQLEQGDEVCVICDPKDIIHLVQNLEH